MHQTSPAHTGILSMNAKKIPRNGYLKWTSSKNGLRVPRYRRQAAPPLKADFCGFMVRYHEVGINLRLTVEGNPGGGKSVLAASIVHELSSCNQNLVYFFFKEQSPFHTASDLAFRAILAQILHKHKHNDDMLDKFIFASNHGDKSSGQSIATPAELRDFLHLCLSSIRNYGS